MGQDPNFEPTAPSQPDEPTVGVPTNTDPIRIVPATSDAAPAAPVHTDMPTQAIPVVYPPAVQAVAPPPVVPIGPDVVYVDDRRPVWPYIAAAVLALIIGGLAGFMIAAAGDDDPGATPTSVPGDADGVNDTFDVLLARTQQDGEYLTPSEYPQLDEITAIDSAKATADLQGQVAMLTEAQEQSAGLTDRVAELEVALADAEAARDELAAQVDSGDTSAELQSQIDARDAQIAQLQSDLTTATDALDAANTLVSETQAELKTTQAERDAANDTLADLDPTPLADYVDGDVAKARSDAAANGWTLIEKPTTSGATPGTVLEQIPAEGSTMVTGSVLYVEVAKKP